jgi:hypothetical protein
MFFLPTAGEFGDAGRNCKVQGLPLLGPVHQEGNGTGDGTGGHGAMPFLPFTEMAHAHAQRRPLRDWRTEEGVIDVISIVISNDWGIYIGLIIGVYWLIPSY